MKNLLLLPLTSAFLLSINCSSFADTLVLQVTTTSLEGKLRAAVYDSQEAYDAGKNVLGITAPMTAGTTQLEIKGLKPGTYGVALYQDKNGNEKLDTSLLGAPNEPFGFSKNPKIGFSAPKFDKFKFVFDGSPMTLNITLNGG